MSSTRQLYKAITRFIDAREAARQKYFSAIAPLDKESPSYPDEMEAAKKARADDTAAARSLCEKAIAPLFTQMTENNSKRALSAPSPEETRILTTVSMMQRPSRKFLDCVSNSLKGSIALTVLDDIAFKALYENAPKEERVITHYAQGASTELSYDTVAAGIQALKVNCEAILTGSGADRTMEKAAQAGTDPDDIQREKPYLNETDFLIREVGADPALFMNAVN